MKVQDTGILIKTNNFKRKLNTRNNTTFTEETDEDESVSSSFLSSITQANPLLSLQETGISEQEKKEHNKKRAEDMISYLEETRLSLLMGKISQAKLEEINRIIENKRELTFDLKLNAILDEIELRTAVELAKITKIKE